MVRTVIRLFYFSFFIFIFQGIALMYLSTAKVCGIDLWPGANTCGDFLPGVMAATILLNLVTATLITSRILYFRQYTQKTVGLKRNNPYITIVIICVESSALVIVFSLIYLILYFKSYRVSYIPMQLLVHVYVSLHISWLYLLSNNMHKNLIHISRRSYRHFSSFTGSPMGRLWLPAVKDLWKMGLLYQHCASNRKYYRRAVMKFKCRIYPCWSKVM